MPKSTQSNAQKYWLDFEKLSAAMIKDQFDMEPTFLRMTPPARDGGFDGEIHFQLSSEKSLNFSFKALMEAKLRADSSDVGLRTFAATLVVAHNKAANAIVIVTNQLFTPQAVQEAARFAQVTRMQIRLVDGPAVAAWVRSRYDDLKGRDYPVGLLDWLMQVTAEESSERAYEIPLALTESGVGDAIVHLKIGAHKNGQLYPCEISVSRTPSNLPPVIGTKRVELVASLRASMDERAGVIVLEGSSGAGKSFLLSHAIAPLETHKNIAKLDLSLFHTVNHLFLGIFERLTGIELHSVAYDAHRDREYICSLLSKALGIQQSEQFVEAVATVILASDESFQSRSSINKAFLADYLGRIAQCQFLLRPFLLVCENLNNATSEVLDFLSSVINTVAPHGLVLIELRTDGDAKYTSPSDWQNFQQVFRKIATLERLHAEELSESDGIALVEHWLPALGTERAQVILRRVGLSPLLIEVACLWLKQRGIVKRTGGDTVTIQHLEKFFEEISPGKATTVIRNLVEFWIGHETTVYRNAIFSAALLEGALPLGWLKQLDPRSSETVLADSLLRTGIFERHRSLRSALRIKHDLLRETCQSLLNKHVFAAEDLAIRLHQQLAEFPFHGITLKRLSAKLAMYAGEYEHAFSCAANLAREVESEGQWSNASAMWELAYQAAERCALPENVRDAMISDALLNLLQAEHVRNRLQLEVNRGRLAALETHIELAPTLCSNTARKVELGLLRWRRLFLLESFDDAYNLARELEQKSRTLSASLQASVLSALALTEKGLGKRAAAEARYDSAAASFPEVGSLQRDRLSNLASSYLTSAPLRSLELYLQMRDLMARDHAATLREALHLDVDIAMAQFLVGRYDDALSSAEKAVATALSNSYETQEARARNIAACCHWACGAIEAASSQIELAVFAAERSFYYRFLWRMRANAAGIAADHQNWKVARQHAFEAIRLIIEPRQGQFANPDIRKERWYVGLLSALHAITRSGAGSEVDELVDGLALPTLRSDLQSLSGNAWPEAVFAGTAHVHADRIMITG